MNQWHSLVAYLATLAAIVALAIGGALVCVYGNFRSETDIAKVIGALGFISAGVTGLIGVIGTFRPRPPTSEPTS